MLTSLHDLGPWLASTPLSQIIQTHYWVVPAVQSVHIVTVAVVITATFLVSLRILGIFDRSEAVAALARRFLPSVWYALIVLLVTGLLLIIGEPERALTNPMLGLKMLMLVSVAGLTGILQRPLAADEIFWEASPQRVWLSRMIAVLSLVLWSGIVFAGRWIAYV